MPIGPAAAFHTACFVTSTEVREKLERAFALEPLGREPDAASRNFRARDGDDRAGIVGLISPCSEPFCSNCRRLRLTASGKLLGCLAQADGIDVRPILAMGPPEREQHLASAVEQAFALKETHRRFDDQKPMVRIGG